MASKKVSVLEDVGTLNQSCITTSFTWTIRDYFTVEWDMKLKIIKSPPFTAFGADWNLYIDPNMRLYENPPWITIGLFSRDLVYSKYSWNYKICIIGENGEHFKPFNSSQYLRDDTDICKNFHYAMPREHFMQNRNQFVPLNDLTLFCQAVLQAPAKKIFQASFLESPQVLLADMRDLLWNGKHSDLKLKVKDTVFNVHKAIISASCPQFLAKYEGIIKDPICDNTIEISDWDSEVVEVLLNYLYSGQVESKSPTIAYQLYLFSCDFKLNSMKTSCVPIMQENLSTKTFCDIYSLAHTHKEDELKEQAKRFFKQNLKEIIASDMWASFVPHNPLLVNELFTEMKPCQLGLKRRLVQDVIERKKLCL